MGGERVEAEGIKLRENIAAIGMELGGRGKAYQEFYEAQNDGWLSVTNIVVSVAENFTRAEERAEFQYDWIISIEEFVDRLLRLPRRGSLREALVVSAANEAIAAAKN